MINIRPNYSILLCRQLHCFCTVSTESGNKFSLGKTPTLHPFFTSHFVFQVILEAALLSHSYCQQIIFPEQPLRCRHFLFTGYMHRHVVCMNMETPKTSHSSSYFWQESLGWMPQASAPLTSNWATPLLTIKVNRIGIAAKGPYKNSLITQDSSPSWSSLLSVAFILAENEQPPQELYFKLLQHTKFNTHIHFFPIIHY